MEKHRNNFTLLRLLAAISIIIVHAYAVTGNNIYEPLANITNDRILGSEIRLYVFFFTSGYLVTYSLVNSKKIWHFLAKRGLRIYPALIAVVLITVFIVGPIFSSLSIHNYFSNTITWGYLVTVTGVRIKFLLPGLFDTKQFFENGVNSSLWSIALEIKLYLLLTLIRILNFRKSHLAYSIISAIIIAICIVCLAYDISFTNPFIDGRVLKLTAMFFIGSLIRTMHLSRKQLKQVFVVSLLLFIPRFWITLPHSFVLVELLMVGTGILLVVEQQKIVINIKTDLSYGIYIYAFVVQQIWFQIFNCNMSPILNITLTLIITVPIAYLSWKFIEAPALKLKNKLP